MGYSRTCEPSMKKCGNCGEIWTCESSPFLTKDKEIDAWAWGGYNRLRANLCLLEESDYNKLYDLLMHNSISFKLRREAGIPELEGEREWTVKWWIMGLERVHRMLLKMEEEGAIKVLVVESNEA